MSVVSAVQSEQWLKIALLLAVMVKFATFSLTAVLMPPSFPAVFLEKFVDAQGVQIPILATQDVEVCLRDVTGRTVRLKETVAVSDRVEQPIMCFGHLLQSGRGVDAQQHALVHSTTGTSIPVELQQKSMVVCGTIRAIHGQLTGDEDVYIRAIQAEIDPGVVNGAVGWELDARGCGAGRHFADRFQDPMLVKPDVSGAFYRTTLVQADGKWCHGTL